MKLLDPFHSRFRKLNLLAAFALCVISSLLALHILDYPLIGIDDANIYFVYARNVANGYGFVYNVGGERVEGFTSLLWTLVCTLTFNFSTRPELTLLMINIVLLSLGIACALNYIQDVFSKEGRNGVFWSAVFLVLMVSSPRYIVWNTITLMENALWSTLLLLTTIFVVRDHTSSKDLNRGFIPLGILLLITRPESIVWVAIFAVILILRMAAARNFIEAMKSFAPTILSIALTLVLLTLFRIWYFGYPLPNTYYAKVSPSFAYNLEQGALYLIRYFLSDPIAAISIITILLSGVYSLFRPASKDGASFLPLIAITGLLLPVLTGGDHFGSFRFYQNIYPILILCLIYFLGCILPRLWEGSTYPSMTSQNQTILLAGLGLTLASGFVLIQTHSWLRFAPEINAEFRVAEFERRNGTFIQGLFSSLPQLPSVGVIASGGIKYSYEGEIIDLLGLNNVEMAHNHGNREGYKGHAAFEVRTFYELQPDIVWPVLVNHEWKYNEMELHERWENTLGFKGLFDDPHFLQIYQYARVSGESDENKLALVAWFKKDFLRKLTGDSDFQVVGYEYSP